MRDSIYSYFENFIKRSYGLKVSNSLVFSDRFFKLLETKKYDSKYWFTNEPLLFDENMNPDYLGTCFYMLNSLQEFSHSQLDKYGRFSFYDSYQHRFDCQTENLVDAYVRTYFTQSQIQLPEVPSRFFLSHDIDSLFDGFWSDSRYLLKKMKISEMLKLIFAFALGARSRKNIDTILRMESEADVKSTFFWLVANEADQSNKIKNGDYSVSDDYVQIQLSTIEKSPSHQNGLHKSTIERYSYDDEIAMFPDLALTTNRNHYLKFTLPNHYEKIGASSLKSDCSLGFPEAIGYRNSFGLPFQPYDFTTQKAFEFLEIPLHIMETTFLTYQSISIKEIEKQIIDFIDKSSVNNVISILWHNDKLTQYKFSSMLTLYKKLLELIYESNLETVLPSELCKQYLSSEN